MRRVKYKKTRKLQPNSLEYAGSFPEVPISMQLFIYDENTFEEYNDLSLKEIEEILLAASPNSIKWFNLHGLHDIDLLKEVGSFFHIESYIMAEILNFSRRTRVEELDNTLFFSVKAILPSSNEDILVGIEQISFILQENVLLSFQEKRGAFFNLIRERIRTKTGQIRRKDSGYLLYGLLDSLMESYFVTLDLIEDNVEQILLEARTKYHKQILVSIEEYTQQLQEVKRAIIPLREVLYNLKTQHDKKNVESQISRNSIVFFDRLQYKSYEMLDQIDYNLNKLDSATNYYFSSQSNRMNEIMKVLTIVSVVFIPLTFIVGVYGMNFENMPELKTENGYFYTLWVMLGLVVLMISYFKWRKWF
ncbi:magnesium/cobalt transporter CorA [Myroides odoratimimus]|uniref:magnesium/cobalt transporter CorA n=1 Tax=Myroides TaxID=76831 RepID=UPI000245F5AE|nr:magnesium/cobalt transporter CorA [Myroides odoratimimus]EHO10066.1 magnesium and cobalt transporter CorA [Myroides odoratimimus CCUG 12901]EPH12352.1 magnesium and cobalt transporter CorA [Myroides odoratimimus CCUG 12700]MDM1092870.1 magnesium/cobalt transporter CorA [Myroides odoratimimus]MDM1410301.1 magnesium/cobalt transporter CorA [Myroides odoratimimus]MDM1498062.1 magnesium/cobalt transporter CorA [Myroides odoratimimus]